jgi:hypothetical protein
MNFDKLIEFFVEYLLLGTMMIISVGIGWAVGIKIKQSAVQEATANLHQAAAAAGAGQFRPTDGVFEWVTPAKCEAAADEK